MSMEESLPGTGTTVLVLDDEPFIQSAAQRILELYGYKAYTAGTAHEALEALDGLEGPLHLILCDLVLPGLGGREAANIILARHPEARVLYMSGYSSHDSFRHDLEASGEPFLAKPFEVTELLEAVAAALDG